MINFFDKYIFKSNVFSIIALIECFTLVDKVKVI